MNEDNKYGRLVDHFTDFVLFVEWNESITAWPVLSTRLVENEMA